MRKQKQGWVQLQQRMLAAHQNQYVYPDVDYQTVDVKIRIECAQHGIFQQTPANHLRGQGCPICGALKRKEKERLRIKTNRDKFIGRANDIHQFKYDYAQTEYLGAHSLVHIKCPQHGMFTLKAYSHLNGQGCGRCAGKHITTEIYVSQCRDMHGDKYDYSKVMYISDAKKVCIVCNQHGEFWQIANNHKRGAHCPKCKKKYWGEVKIRNQLIEHNIQFEEQKGFDNCKWKRKLKFDFYVPLDNTVIEFHGIQHYQYVPFIHKNVDRFQEQLKRDIIKREYCRMQNIKYIEVNDTNLREFSYVS